MARWISLINLQGIYTSPPISIPLNSDGVLSKVSWEGNAPEGSQFVIQTRLSFDGYNWTEWRMCTNEGQIPEVDEDTSLYGSYIMYRVIIKSNSYSITYNSIYTQQLMDKYGVAWFKMDEDSGNILDSKGSFTGIPNGTTIVDGIRGKARSFNGVSDYVQFNNPVIPVGKKSIRFRMKAPRPSVTIRLIDNSGNSGNYGIQVMLSSTGTIIFQTTNGLQGSVFNHISSNKLIFDDMWHDVLFTWDGTLNSNGIKLFIDDMTVPDSVATATVLEAKNPSMNLRIANNSRDPGFFQGILDELEIYNEAIDPIPKKTLLSSNNKIYSLNDGLIELPSTYSQKEQHFIDFGIDDYPIEFPVLNKITSITDTNTTLGLGKTYEHTIDLSKRRVDKIVLE